MSMHATPEPHNYVGTVLGFMAGAYKATEQLASSHLSWVTLLDTAVFAATGACVGFLVNLALNWLKKKLKRRK